MDMESAKTQALRKHAGETAVDLAIACQMLWASASDKNAGMATDVILAILKDADWNRMRHARPGIRPRAQG